MASYGRRLTPDERRGQLVGVGAELFAELPYEDVLMSVVAERAGVSRALVYRYFPNKRDLFAAIYQRAADELLAVITIDPAVPLDESVTAGVEAHIDYFEANAHTVLAANRTLAGDPVIQGIITAELNELRLRVLDGSGLDGHARDLASAALYAWLNFVRAICVEWLLHRTISRAELCAVCRDALFGALRPAFSQGPGRRADTASGAVDR